MTTWIQKFHGVLRELPQIASDLQAARRAVDQIGEEILDLLPIEVISLMVPNLNPPEDRIQIEPPPPPKVQPPPPKVQPPPPKVQPPPPKVQPATEADSGAYPYIPLDLGGHYPSREKPLPPKIHRPAHIVEQERQAEQAKVEAVLCEVPKHINAIHAQSGIAIEKILAMLCQLELQGRVQRLSGERYARIADA
jgi:hypothetical protein